MTGSRRPKSVMIPPRAGEVLVVDDDRQLRDTAVEILALGGFQAAGVDNGAEALRWVSRETPRVILLDLRMPVMDGWEFLRRRAASPALAGISVLILSGEPRDPELLRAVDGWIAKPFTEEELLEAVGSLLRAHEASRQSGEGAGAQAARERRSMRGTQE